MLLQTLKKINDQVVFAPFQNFSLFFAAFLIGQGSSSVAFVSPPYLVGDYFAFTATVNTMIRFHFYFEFCGRLVKNVVLLVICTSAPATQLKIRSMTMRKKCSKKVRIAQFAITYEADK